VFNGELLRKVRTAQGITLDDIAARTRISRKTLENVEADRYGDLPAQVYLRGTLMGIATTLGLDPLRVAKGYLELCAAAKPPPKR
jgi:cytoskeletal protein RodZ